METDDLRKEWKKNKITWLGRLKAEYFIALQNSFLSDLGRVGLLKPPAIYESLNGVIIAVEKDVVYSLGKPFATSADYVFLLSGQSKEEIEKQDIIFSGNFVVHFIKTLEAAAGNVELPDLVKTKINGLLERKDQVIKLIKKNNPKSHSIENYLKVEIQREPPPSTAERRDSDGIVILYLWPE